MSNIYEGRIKTLQKLLEEDNIIGAFIQKPRNLYYYTGTSQPSNLWIPINGPPIHFTRRVHEKTVQSSSISNIVEIKSFTGIKEYLTKNNALPPLNSYIGVEIDFIPYNLINKLKKTFNNNEIKNVTPLTMKQRFVKDEFEISKIQNSVDIWQKAYESLIKSANIGMTEYELAAAFENIARKNGGDGLVWFHRWDATLPGGGIVTSGRNAWEISGHAMTVTGVGMSEALPWGASQKKVQQGELVVVDYGICSQGYHGDMARTFCIGQANNKQKDLWNKLVDLHLSVIEGIRPGVTGKHVYQKAVELAEKMNLADYFMGNGKNRGAYIGHSIGLEIDEFPVIGPKADIVLEENNIITIEPKFMVPGVGSVMVEDDVLVTDNGNAILGNVDYQLKEVQVD